MKKEITIILIFVSLILISGCNTQNKGVIDCGNDFTCFIEMSEDCSPAKVNWESTAELFGIIGNMTKIAEFRGIENGKCHYIETIKDVVISFNEELKQKLIDQNKSEDEITAEEGRLTSENREVAIGLGYDCKFELEGLKDKFNRWKEGEFNLTSSCNIENCTYGGDYEGCTSLQDNKLIVEMD